MKVFDHPDVTLSDRQDVKILLPYNWVFRCDVYSFT